MSNLANSQIYNPQAMLEEHYRDIERPEEPGPEVIYARDAFERSGGAIGTHLELPKDWVDRQLAARREATPFSEGERMGITVDGEDDYRDKNDYSGLFDDIPGSLSDLDAYVSAPPTTAATTSSASLSIVALLTNVGIAMAAAGGQGTTMSGDEQEVDLCSVIPGMRRTSTVHAVAGNERGSGHVEVIQEGADDMDETKADEEEVEEMVTEDDGDWDSSQDTEMGGPEEEDEDE